MMMKSLVSPDSLISPDSTAPISRVSAQPIDLAFAFRFSVNFSREITPFWIKLERL
jgi:hypothetical protein